VWDAGLSPRTRPGAMQHTTLARNACSPHPHPRSRPQPDAAHTHSPTHPTTHQRTENAHTETTNATQPTTWDIRSITYSCSEILASSRNSFMTLRLGGRSHRSYLQDVSAAAVGCCDIGSKQHVLMHDGTWAQRRSEHHAPARTVQVGMVRTVQLKASASPSAK
jgi:hypothetical protein